MLSRVSVENERRRSTSHQMTLKSNQSDSQPFGHLRKNGLYETLILLRLIDLAHKPRANGTRFPEADENVVEYGGLPLGWITRWPGEIDLDPLEISIFGRDCFEHPGHPYHIVASV